MKKVRKIYGVYGMMEYQAMIHIGKASMKVQFSDGSMTAMGTNPATFTTDNFMTQHAIEHSSDFKRNRIVLIKTIPLEGEVEILRPHAEAPAPAATPKQEAAPEQVAAAPEATEAPAEAEAPAPAEEEKKPLTQVEFSNNDDAKDYLEQTFGVVRSKLRNRDAIRAYGEANGVDIIFVNE